MNRVYCDDHGEQLDSLGRCVSVRDGVGSWHRPSLLDTVERHDLLYGPSLLEVSSATCSDCGAVFVPIGATPATGSLTVHLIGAGASSSRGCM